MNHDSDKHDDEQTSTGDEISQDALGDTFLGKNLGQLIREIGRQHKKVLDGSDTGRSKGSDIRDTDTADRIERLNEALDVVSANKENSGPALAFVDHADEEAAAHAPSVQTGAKPAAPHGNAEDAISKALSEIETTMRQFAEAERRRYEKELDAWKAQFKKAAMIAIKKQVETARANWIKKTSENEAKVAEHYKKLKVLADKVAKQKVEIQKAKQELKEKLELADRLHVEFDGIRQVLDGKLGVLDELDKDEDPN